MKTTTIRFTETIRIPYPEGPRAVNALHGYPDGVPLDCHDITDAHKLAAHAVLCSFVVEIEARIREDGAVQLSIVPAQAPEAVGHLRGGEPVYGATHERVSVQPDTRSIDWAISQLGIAHRDLGFAMSARTSEEHRVKLFAAIRTASAQLWAAIRGATLPDAPSAASLTPDLCAQCGYVWGPAGKLEGMSCPVHGDEPMGIEVGLIDIDAAAHSHGAAPPKS